MREVHPWFVRRALAAQAVRLRRAFVLACGLYVALYILYRNLTGVH